ncbi:MAG TPA: hypothetical protein VFI17_08705 [Solirubrobacterales bacterium]|nr:hypothetical protein [Solirubrobacterales bacterium]
MKLRATSLALTLLTVAALAAAGAAASSPEPVRMTNLSVVSAEGEWQADDRFDLVWGQEPADPTYPPVAVDYQLYSPGGAAVGPVVRRAGSLTHMGGLRVPGPGIYTVEAWFEDSAGRFGPRESTTLRFDNSPPPPPRPLSPAGWIGADQPAVLRIGHPDGAPPSGIRGYAFSLDEGGGSYPCIRPTVCTVAETDLANGVGDDEALLGPLPEGTTVARVVAVSGAGVRSSVATAVFKVDATRPMVSLSGVPNGWAAGPVRVRATARDETSGMAAAGPAGPFTGIALDGGAPAVTLGDTGTAVVAGSGLHPVAYFARDAAGNIGFGPTGATNPVLAVVQIDEDAPRVRFAAAQDPSEPERIEATVADPLSGPSPSRGQIAVRAVGSKARFQPLPTTVATGRLRAVWDSDSYPPGKYEFLATGFDAAGNAAVGSDRERGARMILVNPLKTPVRIESGFGGRHLRWLHHTARTVRYGRGVRFGGRLRTMSGAPLADREILVTEYFDAGSGATTRTIRTRTAADGSFTAWLAPGPSRRVVASFAGTKLLSRASGRTTRLSVLAAVRLRASSAVARIGRAPVVFSGQVALGDAAPPRGGLQVELQFRYPGAEWSEFRTVQTDARGHFRYPYSFSDDDSRGVRFQFRAFVAAAADWPYGAAYSRPVFVTGL